MHIFIRTKFCKIFSYFVQNIEQYTIIQRFHSFFERKKVSNDKILENYFKTMKAFKKVTVPSKYLICCSSHAQDCCNYICYIR